MYEYTGVLGVPNDWLILGYNQELAQSTSILGYRFAIPNNFVLSGSDFEPVATRGYEITVTSLLNLFSNVARSVTYNRTNNQTLTINQLAAGYRIVSADPSNSLVLTGTARRELLVFLESLLTLSDTESFLTTFNKSLLNQLGLSQSLVKQVIFNRTLNNTIGIRNGYNRLLPTGTYYPVPGAQIIKASPHIVLQVPSRAIVLPRPLLGDRESLNVELIIKRSMNDTTYTYTRKNSFKRLVYQFELRRKKAFELRDYITNHLSELTTLYNWKGEIWIGYITNNPFEFQVKHKDLYEVTLELEMVRVN